MIVLVTGASSGIGAEICRAFAGRGDTVIALARRQKRLDVLRSELGELLIPVQADVQRLEQVEKAVTDVISSHGRIDVIVNAAGLALGIDPAQSCDLEDWHRMVDTNIGGALNVVHTILPSMVAANSGHIVNIGSVAGSYAYPGGNVYGASKAFIRHFSLNLRADLLGTNVRVTDVQPGLVVGTEFFGVRFKGDAGKAAAAVQKAQGLMPSDVAQSVLWAVDQPARVNVNQIEIMPTAQAFSPLALYQA